jgi:hypothetical protein
VSTLHLLVFSSILPICCIHLWPPALSTIVVYYLSSSLTKAVVSRRSLSRKPFSRFWSPNTMFDAKPYLTSYLSNYCYANLHELLIKSILSSPVASEFFYLHHGCRFVCAKIKYFLSLASTHAVFFSAYLKKIEET